jgi:hypothetical protein
MGGALLIQLSLGPKARQERNSKFTTLLPSGYLMEIASPSFVEFAMTMQTRRIVEQRATQRIKVVEQRVIARSGATKQSLS